MKKKALTFGSMLLALVFFLTACGGGSDSGATETTSDGDDSGSSDETITLQLAENQPDDFPTTIGDKEFARLVEEKTDGRYKIEVYSGGQLGDEKSVIEQIQLGSIDLGRVNGTPLTEFNDHIRSEEHTSELQSRFAIVCSLLLQ